MSFLVEMRVTPTETALQRWQTLFETAVQHDEMQGDGGIDNAIVEAHYRRLVHFARAHVEASDVIQEDVLSRLRVAADRGSSLPVEALACVLHVTRWPRVYERLLALDASRHDLSELTRRLLSAYDDGWSGRRMYAAFD